MEVVLAVVVPAAAVASEDLAAAASAVADLVEAGKRANSVDKT